MLKDFDFSCPVYIACGYTDLRSSWDTLADIVRERFLMDPRQRALFLFCGRRKDRIKGLLWEADGFLLLHKRFEDRILQWPEDEEGVRSMTPEQYQWLMKGLKCNPEELYKHWRR